MATAAAKVLLNAGPSGSRGWHWHENFGRCPQYGAFSAAGLRPAMDAAALGKGSLVHIGNAHFYARMREDQQGSGMADRFYTPAEAVAELARREGGEEHVPTVTEAVERYCAQFAGDVRAKVLLVEEVLSASIDGRLYTQRIDLALEVAGKAWLLDHKSTSRLSKQTVTAHTLSGQMTGMRYLGRKKWGKDFGGVAINAIQIQPYRAKREVLPAAPHLEAQFEARIRDLRAIADRNADRDLFDWPKAMNEHTCLTRYGACRYAELCRLGRVALAQFTQEEG